LYVDGKTVYQVGNKENKLYWDARSTKYQDYTRNVRSRCKTDLKASST